ncbi:NADH-quinone oxidoreductase subunit NuoH [Thermodesulfobacterium sp.]|jgi:NADH-quinone oxidoreductase subunit H|uniref:NADH-quinone oxidoreductase subunit H n=1 Tax=Thermodesulfobacterium commune TaxID=1741 RepID=A0A117LCC4_9BACT|nr:NADH-quinone oxidoreductase subunit NuoH [Thermodesulfobacterium sp.]KUJ97983.1 MAG: NADH-quinone oxidoreductase subunit H [Thermodesulfobacterium sp. 37_54]KUK19109.1 MAG: NADH-quinone oxidoreductase subunit H [Thermodesulfobacterium commune]KUK38183.1 MAG: NADH-quinone oxidoreductase subunit H [Thermodesulfobacterium commune]MBZ4681559.1 NADH-quinone oxidoreductase [Thermodesulfobacterium sp.]MDK2861710.1 NADH-quinone oxidoreductase subunit [Thermodesulfobacterium sp.]
MEDLWSNLFWFLAGTVILLIVSLLHVAYLTYAERKIIARMQQRLGPNRVGPRGLLQPIADMLKLLTKEDIIPAQVDKPVFYIAPFISLVCAGTGIALVPLWENFVISNINVGLLFILALSSLSAYGVILSGWASNSRYAFLGGLRASAQVISYEIAMSLALLSVVLMAGSLNLGDIVRAQINSPFKVYLIPQLLGFFVFIVSAVAECNRTPFDLPEAETELVAGYFVEYSGMRVALFYLAEYFGMLVMSALAVTCFLGGWAGPFEVPYVPFFWFVVKVYALLFFYIWIRATLPRYRYDQLMDLGWKVLIPLGLINLFLTALIKLIF